MISDNNIKKITIIAMVFTVIVIVCLCIFVGIPLVRLASNPEEFRAWVDSKGVLGPLLFVVTVILQILVAFIPGEPLELVAGYTFGTLNGTILCILAESAGSIIVILLVRKFGIRLLHVFFKDEQINKLSFLHSSNKKLAILIILFLVPGTPKDLICYFAGLTDTPLPLLILIASLCRLPSIITSTISGSSFGDGNYVFAIVVYGITLVLSGIGLFIYNRTGSRKK